MNPSLLRCHAQALINYELAGGHPIDPAKLVSQLEKIPGVTAHQADQAAAAALADDETWNHAAFAEALRRAADEAERKEKLQ